MAQSHKTYSRDDHNYCGERRISQRRERKHTRQRRPQPAALGFGRDTLLSSSDSARGNRKLCHLLAAFIAIRQMRHIMSSRRRGQSALGKGVHLIGIEVVVNCMAGSSLTGKSPHEKIDLFVVMCHWLKRSGSTTP
jgi:hypothetical protein